MKRELTQQDIERSLAQAKDGFKLSEDRLAAMRFEVMDVIKSGDVRTIKRIYPLNSRSFAMFLPILLLSLMVAGSGTVALANSAAPGDPLHKIDLWAEKLQSKFVFDEEARARLAASLDAERAAELEAILNSSQGDLNAEAQAKWEARRTEAIANLSTSNEKLAEIRTKFEARLEASNNDKQKDAFEKIIGHLREMEDRRDSRMEKLESAEFPGVKAKTEIRKELKSWLQDHPELKARIREEVKIEFKGDFDRDDDSDADLKVDNSGSGSLNSDRDEDDDNDDDNDDAGLRGSSSSNLNLNL